MHPISIRNMVSMYCIICHLYDFKRAETTLEILVSINQRSYCSSHGADSVNLKNVKESEPQAK